MSTPPTPQQQPTPTGTTPPAKRRMFWIAIVVLVVVVVWQVLFPARPQQPRLKARNDGSEATASESQIEAAKQEAMREVEQERLNREREEARQKATAQGDELAKAGNPKPATPQTYSGGGNYRAAGTAKKSARAVVFDLTSGQKGAAGEAPQEQAPPVIPANYLRQFAQNPQRQTREIADQYTGSVSPNEPAPKEQQAQSIDLLKPDPNWPTTILPEDTVIEGVLMNRLEGANDGPVDVMVTTDVYQRGTHNLVFPQGAEITGETKRVAMLNQERLAVFFHRALVQLPDGTVYGVSLHAPGLDQTGAVALHDKVNHHYVQIFGASLAVGAIGGLANIGNTYGGANGFSTLSSIRSGIGSEMGSSAQQIMSFYLNRMPTITIREGTRVKIMLTGDLQVPLYPAEIEEPK